MGSIREKDGLIENHTREKDGLIEDHTREKNELRKELREEKEYYREEKRKLNARIDNLLEFLKNGMKLGEDSKICSLPTMMAASEVTENGKKATTKEDFCEPTPDYVSLLSECVKIIESIRECSQEE